MAVLPIGFDGREAKRGLEEVVQVIDRVVDKAEEMAEAMVEAEAATKREGGAAEKTAKEIEKVEKALDKTGKETRETKTETEVLNKALDVAAKESTRVGQAFDRQARATDNAGKETEKLRDAKGRFVRTSGEAAQRTQTLNQALGNYREKLHAVRAAMLTLLAVGGGGLAFGATAKTLGDYSEQMAILGAVTRASADDMQRLDDRARALGASTMFSSSQAAEAQIALARAGFSVNETLASSGAALRLATVGQMQLGDAAGTVANVLRTFGLDARDADKVVNQLVVTGNRANTTIPELAEAIKYAGTVLGPAGQSLETVLPLLAVLADRGIKGSMAGTMLRDSFSDLQLGTERTEQTLASMGTTIEGLAAGSRDYAEVLDELRARGMTAERALNLFGIRSAAAGQIFAQSAGRIRELRGELASATDEAQTNQTAIEKSLAGAYRELAGAIEAATLEAGDKGLGLALRTVVDTGRDAVKVLFGLDQGGQEVGGTAKALSVALYAVAGALAAVVVIKFTAWIYGVTVAMLGLHATISPITAALVALGIGIGALAGRTAVANDEFERTNEQLVRMREAAAAIGAPVKAAADSYDALEKALGAYKATQEAGEPTTVALGSVVQQRRANLRSLTDLRAAAASPGAGGLLRADGGSEDIQDIALRAGVWPENLSALRTYARNQARADGTDPSQAMALAALDAAIQLEQQKLSIEEKALQVAKERERLDQQDLAAAEARAQALEGFQDLIAFREEELRLTREGNAEGLAELRLRQSNQEAIKALGADADAYVKQLAGIEAELRRIDDVSRGVVGNRVGEGINELRFQASIIGSTPQEKALQTELYRARAAGATTAQLAEIEQQVRQIQSLERLESVANGIGDAFAASFERAVFEAESLREVVRALGMDILRIIFRQTVTQPLAQGLSAGIFAGVQGIFGGAAAPGAGGPAGPPMANGQFFNSANGNMFRFAMGGLPELVTSPTYFPMRGGTGVYGESGAEAAIAPLVRTRSGRLGVEAVGGGGGVTINAPITIRGVPTKKDAMVARRRVAGLLRGVAADARAN